MLKAAMGSNDDPALKSGEGPGLPNPDLNELREILLGDSWRKLIELEREIHDHGRLSKRVAGVLPDSLRMANGTPAALVGAMQDPTIESISIAARKEQERLSDALAPVIGPSIQRAIGQALQKFTQSIETIAQHNFSVKGLKWRVESARTGIPFHQVVLKHTLKYEVEQIYLIQKPSGLLVTHLMHPDLAEQSVDRDAIAGMMMAIQDFVRDSAFAQSSEQIQTIDMQGKTVWMCHGARALLACVIEGRPPENLRDDIKTVLDGIHGRYQHALREFNGDLMQLSGVDLTLQPLLQRELINEKAESAAKSGPPWWLFAIGAAIVAWLIYITYGGYQIHTQRLRLESALKSTPGVVITDLDHVDGVWVAHGMADPLAFDNNTIAAKAQLAANKLKLDFLPYISLEPSLVLQRARVALEPPSTLELNMNGRVLTLKGSANDKWITHAKNINLAMLNVERIDFSAIKIDSSEQLQKVLEELQTTKLYFAENLKLTPTSHAELIKVSHLITQAQKLASSIAQNIRIVLIGQADATGSDAINAALKIERAQTIKTALIELGVAPQIFELEQGQDFGTESESSRRVDIQIKIFPNTPT